jgi:hypothetical protein
MSNVTITADQLRTVLFATELGDNEAKITRFFWAQQGQSSYSFGVLQFDIEKNPGNVQGFLKSNGFTDNDINELSQHGGLSDKQLAALNAKLQAMPREKIDQFTNEQLESNLANLDRTIDLVRKENPSAADAITKDPKLQLAIADYENQFGAQDGKKHGTQFVSYLAGKQEGLPGGQVQAGDPPVYKDVQKFLDATAYGAKQHQKDARHDAAKSREERLDGALEKLGLSTAIAKSMPSRHSARDPHETLELHTRGRAVHDLQAKLADQGYLDAKDIDGHFGPHTRQAVERFQQDHHLAVDGKAGPETSKALDVAIKGKASAVDKALANLADPRHPDHTLFEQALAGVRALDAHGQPSEQQRLNLAAALTAEAKHEGFARIDQVAVGDQGNRVYIAQNSTSPMEQAKFGSVDTATAVHTPLAQSSAVAASMPPRDQAPLPNPQPRQPNQLDALAI